MKDGYAICLNEWALDKNIKNELGLLLIISSLCAEKGFCWASNEYLAELFDTDAAQISKKIAKLVKHGYLSVTYQKRGTEIISREIRLAEIQTTDVKIDNRPLSKMTTDHCQNSQPTVVKNDKYNNTSNINNTSNNNTRINNKERVSKDTLKKVEYAEFVTMTEEEHEKLINEYGAEFTDKCIETLDNYKGSSGKKYKSDYRAILSWVVSRVQKDIQLTQKYTKPKSVTFADLLREEYGDDKEGNNADYEPPANSISEVLSEYDIE